MSYSTNHSGICSVTIQPEFRDEEEEEEDTTKEKEEMEEEEDCQLACDALICKDSVCCTPTPQRKGELQVTSDVPAVVVVDDNNIVVVGDDDDNASAVNDAVVVDDGECVSCCSGSHDNHMFVIGEK